MPASSRTSSPHSSLSSTERPTCTIKVWAHPGSKEERIAWATWRTSWEVHVKARAVEGEANEAVVDLLSRALAVRPDRIRLLSGARNREKTFRILGLSEEEARARLGRSR